MALTRVQEKFYDFREKYKFYLINKDNFENISKNTHQNFAD